MPKQVSTRSHTKSAKWIRIRTNWTTINQDPHELIEILMNSRRITNKTSSINAKLPSINLNQHHICQINSKINRKQFKGMEIHQNTRQTSKVNQKLHKSSHINPNPHHMKPNKPNSAPSHQKSIRIHNESHQNQSGSKPNHKNQRECAPNIRINLNPHRISKSESGSTPNHSNHYEVTPKRKNTQCQRQARRPSSRLNCRF